MFKAYWLKSKLSNKKLKLNSKPKEIISKFNKHPSFSNYLLLILIKRKKKSKKQHLYSNKSNLDNKVLIFFNFTSSMCILKYYRKF